MEVYLQLLIKGQINCHLKIVGQMSEWSQMTELDNLSKSETSNLATLHRLACTASYIRKLLPIAAIY